MALITKLVDIVLGPQAALQPMQQNVQNTFTSYKPSQLADRAESTSNLGTLLRQNALIHVDNGRFWSKQILRKIVTPEHVLDQLGNATIHSQTKFNPTDYLKIFAILALLNKTDHLHYFVIEKLTDDVLPLHLIDHVDCQISRRSTPAEAIPLFNRWSVNEREGFIQKQYGVNPAYLDMGPNKTVKHEEYEENTVLPFLKEEHIENGGYSSVAEVRIDPSSHGFRDILNSIIIKDVFVLKRISVNGQELRKREKEFWSEVDALKRFSGFVHDHLVTLLMTWTVKNDPRNPYCLLFPCAGKDMDRYWIDTPAPINGPNPDREGIRWCARQIVGLTGALDTIHNSRYSETHLAPQKKYGRHGDIKPENVLWYESPKDERGICVLADLGLTVCNATKSRSNIPNKGLPMSPGYRPPECDLAGGAISRAFDIWTFGCLLLEMVCWALGGQQNRADFEQRRTTPYITNFRTNIFFDIRFTDGGRPAIMVKKQVNEWIAKLHNRPLCTEFFHELLDLIENEMIITSLAGRPRIKSNALLEKVNSMYKRVMHPTDSYCWYPCPRTREAKVDVAVEALLNNHALELAVRRNPDLGIRDGRTQKSASPEELEAMELIVTDDKGNHFSIE